MMKRATAIMEKAELGEESIAKKLTLMKTAKPDLQIYFSRHGWGNDVYDKLIVHANQDAD